MPFMDLTPKFTEPIEWDYQRDYEPGDVVLHEGTFYTAIDYSYGGDYDEREQLPLYMSNMWRAVSPNEPLVYNISINGNNPARNERFSVNYYVSICNNRIELTFNGNYTAAIEESSGNLYRSGLLELPIPRELEDFALSGTGEFLNAQNVIEASISAIKTNYPVFATFADVINPTDYYTDIGASSMYIYLLSGNARNRTSNNFLGKLVLRLIQW